MNEQNAFYQANRGRASGYGAQQQSKFLELSVWPRLIIETIIKRDMGVRYFPFLSVLIVTAFLFFVPYLISMFNNFRIGIKSADSTWEIIIANKTWYIFLVILIFSAFKRRQEIIAYSLKGKGQRYSLSNGRPMRFFYLIETKKRPVTLREIETIYEPLFVILIGFILLLTGNIVGLLLIICGFGYKINYNIMYGINDNYLMEKEDQMIFNEAMVDTLVSKQEKDQAHNGRRPADTDFKRSATNHQENDEDIRAK